MAKQNRNFHQWTSALDEVDYSYLSGRLEQAVKHQQNLWALFAVVELKGTAKAGKFNTRLVGCQTVLMQANKMKENWDRCPTVRDSALFQVVDNGKLVNQASEEPVAEETTTLEQGVSVMVQDLKGIDPSCLIPRFFIQDSPTMRLSIAECNGWCKLSDDPVLTLGSPTSESTLFIHWAFTQGNQYSLVVVLARVDCDLKEGGGYAQGAKAATEELNRLVQAILRS